VKLSEVTGDAPLKLSDVMSPSPRDNQTVQSITTSDTPDPARRASALLSQATKPLRDIPRDIASEFRAGAQTIKDATARNIESLKQGKDPGVTARLPVITGALQELFSPITGSAKALVGDPLRSNLPKSAAGEIAARMAEQGASMMGPGAVAKSLSALSKAMPWYGDAVQKLMDAGVKLTPGQIMQGMFKRAEDSLRSFPGLGYIIAGGQYRALEDFNRAVLNRALSNIGEKLPKDVEMGPKAIAAADRLIGQRYDKLLPKLTFTGDPTLGKDVTDITTKAMRQLPEAQQKQWKNLLQDITSRTNPGFQTDGYTYRQIDSELSYLARTYGRSPDPAQKLFADSVNDLRAAMREALERSNPKYAQELRGINAAWAAFERARGASIRRMMSNGVFSPADLLQEIKQSTTRGVFARGDGLLQDLASAGNKVLPSTVPDSGTAQRALWAEIAGTGGAAVLDHPNIAIGIATGSAPYTRPGMAAINRAAKGAPEVGREINKALRSPGAMAGAALPGPINDLINQQIRP